MPYKDPIKERENSKLRKARYRAKNKTKIAEYAKNYAINNKNVVAERKKRWAEANPERIKKSIIKRLYNITPEDLKVLHIKQRSKCAICGKSEKEVGTLVIDHCHNTGKVRGLLCRKHNAGIGLLGDNYKSVQNAANYLRRFDNKQ